VGFGSEAQQRYAPPNGKDSSRDKAFEEYMYDPAFLQVFPVPEIRIILRIEQARRQSPHRFGVIRAALRENPKTGNGSTDKTVYDLEDGKVFDKLRPTHWTDASNPPPFEKIRDLVDRVAEETAARDKKKFVRAAAGRGWSVVSTPSRRPNHWKLEEWDGIPTSEISAGK
jgi:hypothetical protein